jgi:hypothetical protein
MGVLDLITPRPIRACSLARPVDRVAVERWSVRLFGAAVIVGVAARLWYARGAPLWFDESFAGTIATQPDFAALLRWCLTELTGPGYYVPLWLWTQVTGASDAALRLPSLLCSLAAPLLLWRWGHPDPAVRRAWAGAALLSLPAIAAADLARPYALLFLLACAQAIVFRRLLVGADRRRAFAWSSVSALLVLTHYSAVPLVAIQAALGLVRLRRDAARLWPALLPGIPVLVWATLHLPFVLALTGGSGPTSAAALSDLVTAPGLLFGVQAIGVLILGCVAATAVLPAFRHAAAALDPADRSLAAAGLLTTVLVLAAATLHGGVTARYLTSLLPSLLFALALWVRWSVRVDERPALGVAVAMLAGTIGLLVSARGDREEVRHRFGVEPASAWLAEAHPQRVIFLWSDPIGAVSGDRNIADVAGFGFRRLGRPVSVAVAHPVVAEDPNATLLARATHANATAILWLAKVDVANLPPVRIAARDPRWECRDFGDAGVRAAACRRDPVNPRVRPGPSARSH